MWRPKGSAKPKAGTAQHFYSAARSALGRAPRSIPEMLTALGLMSFNREQICSVLYSMKIDSAKAKQIFVRFGEMEHEKIPYKDSDTPPREQYGKEVAAKLLVRYRKYVGKRR